MSALPVSADEQYCGPQADALDDERHIASRYVDVSIRRLERGGRAGGAVYVELRAGRVQDVFSLN